LINTRCKYTDFITKRKEKGEFSLVFAVFLYEAIWSYCFSLLIQESNASDLGRKCFRRKKMFPTWVGNASGIKVMLPTLVGNASGTKVMLPTLVGNASGTKVTLPT
jgi:hypothetical protein